MALSVLNKVIVPLHWSIMDGWSPTQINGGGEFTAFIDFEFVMYIFRNFENLDLSDSKF